MKITPHERPDHVGFSMEIETPIIWIPKNVLHKNADTVAILQQLGPVIKARMKEAIDRMQFTNAKPPLQTSHLQ